MAETETPPPAEDSAEPTNPPEDTSSTEGGESESIGESLEGGADDGVIDATSEGGGSAAATPPPEPPKGGIKQKLRKFNLYLLLFVFIIIIAAVIIVIAYLQSQKSSTTSTVKTQTLTQSTLQQVANSDATVGNAQSVLNVESSAVFAGKVLIRDDLEVAGTLRIGGTVALNDITVSGSSQLGQVSVSQNLAVSGDTAIQGAETIAKSLQVNGPGTFSGPLSTPQLTTPSLQLTGDLVLDHHISAGGGTPGQSNGSALGSGGSASVSGSDTAGTVTINVGSGSLASGCFISINFTTKYNATPHVLLTPVGAQAGGIPYYVTRTPASFSICDASAPATGTSFAFDYFVVGS